MVARQKVVACRSPPIPQMKTGISNLEDNLNLTIHSVSIICEIHRNVVRTERPTTWEKMRTIITFPKASLHTVCSPKVRIFLISLLRACPRISWIAPSYSVLMIFNKRVTTDVFLQTSIEDKIRKVGFERTNPNRLRDIWMTGNRMVRSRPPKLNTKAKIIHSFLVESGGFQAPLP